MKSTPPFTFTSLSKGWETDKPKSPPSSSPSDRPVSYEFSPSAYTSSKFMQRLRTPMEDYTKFIRDPSRGDLDWGSSTAYNISSVHRIVNTSMARIKAMTWRENRRMFTLTLQNPQVIKNKYDVVNPYLEGASAFIAKQLSSVRYFSDTITCLIRDYIEFGFCYAFMREDPTLSHPLGLNLVHISPEDMFFNIGENKDPDEFVIKAITTSNTECDTDFRRFLIHIYKIPGPFPQKWKIKYLFSEDVSKNSNSMMETFIEGDYEDEVVDYCPILYSRYSANGDNPLGFGVGLSCLGIIKELHNAMEIKKGLAISNSKAILISKSGVVTNTTGENSPSAPNVDYFAAYENKTDPATGLPIKSKFDAALTRYLCPSTSLLPSSMVDVMVMLEAQESGIPVSDQITMIKPEIPTQYLNEFIQSYQYEIELAFDPNAIFKQGQSRMSVAEVDDRRNMDAMTSGDLMNPILNNIISPYLKQIVVLNSKTLLHPDTSLSKSRLGKYVFYIDPTSDDPNLSQIQPEDAALILTYTSDVEGIDFVWDDQDEAIKKQQALASMQAAVSLVGAALQLKQLDPSINTDDLMKDIQVSTNVKLASQSQQAEALPDFSNPAPSEQEQVANAMTATSAPGGF